MAMTQKTFRRYTGNIAVGMVATDYRELCARGQLSRRSAESTRAPHNTTGFLLFVVGQIV